MGYTTRILPALLLVMSTTVNAEYLDNDPGIANEERWSVVAPDMSDHEITRATLHNQRLAGNTLRKYSENVFTSIGLSKKNIDFVGAAIGLAVHDVRYHLDDSKMLALELRDVADGERALFFGLNVDW